MKLDIFIDAPTWLEWFVVAFCIVEVSLKAALFYYTRQIQKLDSETENNDAV